MRRVTWDDETARELAAYTERGPDPDDDELARLWAEAMSERPPEPGPTVEELDRMARDMGGDDEFPW